MKERVDIDEFFKALSEGKLVSTHAFYVHKVKVTSETETRYIVDELLPHKVRTKPSPSKDGLIHIWKDQFYLPKGAESRLKKLDKKFEEAKDKFYEWLEKPENLASLYERATTVFGMTHEEIGELIDTFEFGIAWWSPVLMDGKFPRMCKFMLEHWRENYEKGFDSKLATFVRRIRKFAEKGVRKRGGYLKEVSKAWEDVEINRIGKYREKLILTLGKALRSLEDLKRKEFPLADLEEALEYTTGTLNSEIKRLIETISQDWVWKW